MNGSAGESLSLDAVHYDPIDHLNLLFGHPSTVSSISRVSTNLNKQNNALSTEITALETAQAYGPDSSLERMQSAQAELAGLFRKIETVRSRAIQTEQNITSMTADIKRLDGTKRNLTLSMTALKRLQMLTTAYEQLRGLAKTRQYRESPPSAGVGDLQRELLEQICEDFELAFAKGEVAARRSTLIEACGVMDALGEPAKSRLVACLDNIGRRYAWFRRMIKTYEEEHYGIFPPHWKVGEVLATAFCDGTRDDFKGILERSMRRTDGVKIDVNLLLSCLQETMDFEQGLERKFADRPRASIDTINSVTSSDERTQSFNGSVSVAFEPYLSLWVDSQDKALASMIPRYKAQPLIPPDEEFSPQAVINSAIELFHFYKVTLSQCAKLSTSERGAPLQGASVHDVILVLNTADFWHTNSEQLEDSIKKRIDPELSSKVDLSSQADSFLGVASAAVGDLVNKVELECEVAWREMKNTNWSKMESVGDQSSYVGELVKQVNSKTEEILAVVVKPQYARAFADNLVEHLSNTYISNIVQCRPVSEVGAEQPHVPPAGFVKRVNAAMTRIDPLLKTLQVRPSPPEGLVQAYLIHIGDRSDTNFKKILELKGVRKQDHGHLLELFAIHRDSASNDKLVQQSALLTPLLSSNGIGSGGLGITLNTNLAGGAGANQGATRFDPTSLGEKLLSAARDGVERIGTPAAGQGGSGAGNSSGNNGGVEGNLKNFGKFFRRDIGGLGLGLGRAVLMRRTGEWCNGYAFPDLCYLTKIEAGQYQAMRVERDLSFVCMKMTTYS
ncbi:Vps53-like protein [Apiospora hydei]|uniref:Vps53-like protein n=1 Tax=Apiospora hydei TaxID=1337664 RepID=A0ABR1VX87_9PEZI